MAYQPSFKGFEPTPKPVASPWTRKKHKFFFALRPDDIAADAAISTTRKLRHAHGLMGNLIRRENLHVSLLMLLECDEPPHDLTGIASAAVQAIQAKPFDIVFDMALSFPQKTGHCLVLGDTRGAAGIYDLQRRFVMRFNPRNRGGSMTSHMTLMYPAQFVEKQPIDPIRWKATEFVLIDSWQGLGRHDTVGRWPLR